MFFFFAIYQWVNASLILCAVGCYGGAIRRLDATYGKIAFFEGLMLFIINCVAGGVNYWFAKGGVLQVTNLTDEPLNFALASVSYFSITEFIPALLFAYTSQNFCQAIYPPPPPREEPGIVNGEEVIEGLQNPDLENANN